LGGLIRGEAERNIVGLEYIVAQKKNPKTLERHKLEKEVLGSMAVCGTGADRTIRLYPTSCQNLKQTMLVRSFGMAGFAQYHLPYRFTGIRKAENSFFHLKIKIENEREKFCNFNDRPYGHK
jgi:hypothetical protein